MSFRVKLKLTLPNSGRVNLTRFVNVPYENVLEIIQVGVLEEGDVAKRVGIVACLLETLTAEQDPGEPVTGWLGMVGMVVYLNLTTGNAVVKCQMDSSWWIGAIYHSDFVSKSSSDLWRYLREIANPLSPQPTLS